MVLSQLTANISTWRPRHLLLNFIQQSCYLFDWYSIHRAIVGEQKCWIIIFVLCIDVIIPCLFFFIISRFSHVRHDCIFVEWWFYRCCFRWQMVRVLLGSVIPQQRLILSCRACRPRLRKLARRSVQVQAVVVWGMGRSPGRRQTSDGLWEAGLPSCCPLESVLARTAGESLRQVISIWYIITSTWLCDASSKTAFNMVSKSCLFKIR